MSYPSGFNYQAPIPKKAPPTSLNSQYNYSSNSSYSNSPSTSPVPDKNGQLGNSFMSEKSVNSSGASMAGSVSTIVPSGGGSETTVPSLEELLDDCFHDAINQPLSAKRKQMVNNFEKYMASLHTQENLSFVIEIFKYEYYYDKIFPYHLETLRLTSPSPLHYSNSFLNRSLDKSLDNLPYPTKKVKNKNRSRYHQRKKSSNSIKSEDHEPTLVFVSTIDDLGNEDEFASIRAINNPTPNSSMMNQAWDSLRESNLSDDDDDDQNKSIISISDDDSHLDSSPENPNNPTKKLTFEERQLLTNQWDLILNNYIYHDSPEQINISQKSSKEILDEDHKDDDDDDNKIHNPIKLMRAKNEILQIIKENAYLSFIKKNRSLKLDSLQDSNSLPNCCQKSSKSNIHDHHLSPVSPNSLHNQSISPPNFIPKASSSSSPKLSNSPIDLSSNLKKKSIKFSNSPHDHNDIIFGDEDNDFSRYSSSPKLIPNEKPPPPASSSTSPQLSSFDKSVTQSSSISNLLGHLKIHTGKSPNSYSPSYSAGSTPTTQPNLSFPRSNSNPQNRNRSGSLINQQSNTFDNVVTPVRPESSMANFSSENSGTIFKFGKIWKSKKKQPSQEN